MTCGGEGGVWDWEGAVFIALDHAVLYSRPDHCKNEQGLTYRSSILHSALVLVRDIRDPLQSVATRTGGVTRIVDT